MRKNDYNSIDEFTSQYTGEWAPSEGHWFGLDFSYNGREYRFNTGSMFNRQSMIEPFDGTLYEIKVQSLIQFSDSLAA